MQRIEIGSTYMRAVHSRMMQALPTLQNGDFIITERTLRFETLAEANKNSYDFNMFENKGSDRPLERKLNRNDGFVLSHIGFGLTKQDLSTNPPKYGNFPVFTHPDPNFFSGAAGGNTEVESLESAYSGALTVKVNNTEIIQQFALLHNRLVPERGYTLQGAPQLANEWPQYGPSIEERGFYPYSINVIFNGQDNNVITLEMGQGNTSLIAGGVDDQGAAVNTRNVLVVMLHGYEIAEASQSGLRWGTF